MINGLEGIPRSGKSYEAAVYHVLEALKTGRKVITNLPLDVDVYAMLDTRYRDLIEIRTKSLPVLGTWDADRVPAFKLFEAGETESEIDRIERGVPLHNTKKPLFGQVWDFYSTFKDAKGRGPLYLIDECHVSLPKIGTSVEVEQWFKLHGHFNADVLLITQSFREMSQSIAGNIAMLIRVRKADILGKPTSYIRKVHAGYRGAVISTEERKYKPEFFSLYKSHTQGNSVAESLATDVSPFSVKFKRFSWGFYALTAVVLAYAFWPQDKPISAPLPPGGAALVLRAKAHEAAAVVGVPSPEIAIAAAAAASAPPSADEYPEPFSGSKIHLSGWMRMGGRLVHSFVVSAQGYRLFELQEREIVAAGYIFRALGECSGVLTFRGKQRAVICDAPMVASGRNNAPLVMTTTASGEVKTSRD